MAFWESASKKRAKALKAGDDKAFIEKALARFKVIADAEESQREQELDDLRFCDPMNQWPDNIRNRREAEGSPCLTVDRITPVVQQICNEQRQNRPSVKVSPVADGADRETAEIYQGIIRHIEYSSDADVAYDTALESTVRCGRGYFRVLTEYSDPETFEQDIVIRRIPNLHTVYMDPGCIMPDYSDAEDCFIVADLSGDQFADEYPNAKLSQEGNEVWKSLGDDTPDWVAGDGQAIRVAEYFWKERDHVVICELADGTTCREDALPEGADVKRRRDAMLPVIKWVKMTAVEILERTEWPGKWIPVIPVLGKELIIDGERIYAGVIRQSKDSQRLHNYMKSNQAQTIALAPKAPWVGPVGFMGSRKTAWANANRNNPATLEYEVIMVNGQPMPEPHRDVQEPPITAITQAIAGTVDDIKATTGMFDASMGNREADQSGRAILALQNQGQTGNFHFQDNLSRAIRHLGRILVDLIPKIYDTQRVLRIVKEDGSAETVTVNGPQTDPKTGAPVVDPETGVAKIYDLKSGKYDVTVSSGPSFQTKRQQSLAFLLEFTKSVPMVGQVAPDLIASQSDSPISEELQKRLQMGLPPQFQKQQQGQSQLPPQVQAQMQQAQGMVQQLTQALHQAKDELEAAQAGNDTKVQIAAMQERTKLLLGVAQLQGQAAQAQLEQEISVLNAQADRTHEVNLQAQQGQQDLASQVIDQQHQQQMQQMAPSGSPAGGSSDQPQDAGASAGKETLNA